MKNIFPVEWSNQRVLTTAQIADLYSVPVLNIKSNFRYSKERFTEGVHFFKLAGDDLRALKWSVQERVRDVLKGAGQNVFVNPIPKLANSIILWTVQGAARHAQILGSKAREVFAELEKTYFNRTSHVQQRIAVVQNVRGYVDEKGVAWLNVEDVARGLGFTQTQEKVSPTSGGKIYTSIRWERIRAYLAEFGYQPVAGSCDDINGGSYIPENWFYLLAMKANNEPAKKFQLKIANEILPSIRKTGSYNAPAANIPARRKSPSKTACAYAFKMSDNSVKIGHTGNIKDRILRIRGAYGLEVDAEHHTPMMAREDARHIERTLHRKFAAVKIDGEFFSAAFPEVCDELDRLSGEICIAEETVIEYADPDAARMRLLVDLLHVPIDSPLKEELFKETANLILGRQFFLCE